MRNNKYSKPKTGISKSVFCGMAYYGCYSAAVLFPMYLLNNGDSGELAFLVFFGMFLVGTLFWALSKIIEKLYDDTEQ